MANNYTHFSLAFHLKGGAKAKSWIENLLRKADGLAGDDTDDEDILETFPNWADYQCTGFEWNIDGDELFLHDNGGEGNCEAVATFVQAYLKRFDKKGRVGFGFADTCSSPRVDEFGGGACVVTAKKQKWFNTYTWLNKELSK